MDVAGKGVDAGTRALLLSGAFGGLLGSVPQEEFLSTCNAYLRRGEITEGFVTAVHLALDLTTGEYIVTSAGHPPAAHLDSSNGTWRITQARGIVLGVVADLRLVPERGVLRPGDALMLYPTGSSRPRARTSTTGPTGCSGRRTGWSSPGSGRVPPIWSGSCKAAATTARSPSSGEPDPVNPHPM